MVKLGFYFVVVFGLFHINGISQNNHEMKKVKRGAFIPLYGSDSNGVFVKDFMLDVYPVTNQQYLEFVKEYPKWKRSKVLRLFADESYLNRWVSDTILGKNIDPQAAATTVSWYAAKDYCACQGKRLPSIDEWEYAAMASETKKNAQADSIFNQKIIEGYELPKTYKNKIGSTFKNYWGIWDLHGLVWEWTSDFNSVLISGESRQDVDTERNLFCGSAAINASNLMDYAAFMRYAFRGSIKANYGIQTLGFRCAKSIKK
ncbi:MAG: formylglycine-generating enzyme family protein [Flavobacteriales bacterium]|nr:formylglycine-generating enzyme family protein [Flavobacteriales bacterium]